MEKYKKLIITILLGKSDNNIEFNDLCKLLENLGFDKRIKGSHHIFRKQGIITRLNLQRDGKKAKEYQVRQIRKLIIDNKISGDLDV